MRSSLPALLLAAAALGACTVGSDYRRPDLPLTAGFRTAPPPGAAAAPVSAVWWDGFRDPELSRVVARALAENLDIARAQARVVQSRAQARAADAALLPAGSATAGAANESQSLESPIGEIGHHLPGFERTTNEYQAGIGASWDIDLFGGLRRGQEAAGARARAGVADLHAVQLAMAADSADTYLQIRAYQARLTVARQQEGVENDLVDLLGRREAQGVASNRELRQMLAERERVRAGIPALVQALETQFNRLDVLMGAQPGTWRGELEVVKDIPAAPSVSAAEGPPSLLRRRPDVAAAEQRLIAANAGIGEEISDYYPKLSISGLLGLDSVDASQFLTGAAAEHQIGAGLRWRLFDFGRVDAEVDQARGAYAEDLAAWRETVLTAAGEVETALSAMAEQDARAGALAHEIDDLRVARAQAREAYEAGAISLIEVRDADRDLLTASDDLAQTRADAARAAVAAYRALGGGWTS